MDSYARVDIMFRSESSGKIIEIGSEPHTIVGVGDASLADSLPNMDTIE